MKTTTGRGILVTLLAAVLSSPVLAGAASAAARGPAVAARTQAAGPSQGPLLGWGLNDIGQLGTGDKATYDGPVLVNAPYGLRATSVRTGNFSVAVNASGQVYAWGPGQLGQLGNGAFDNHLRPVKARLPKGVRVRAAREGMEFVVALTTTGKVLAWGLGTSGQLGNGHRDDHDAPV